MSKSLPALLQQIGSKVAAWIFASTPSSFYLEILLWTCLQLLPYTMENLILNSLVCLCQTIYTYVVLLSYGASDGMS